MTMLNFKNKEYTYHKLSYVVDTEMLTDMIRKNYDDSMFERILPVYKDIIMCGAELLTKDAITIDDFVRFKELWCNSTRYRLNDIFIEVWCDRLEMEGEFKFKLNSIDVLMVEQLINVIVRNVFNESVLLSIYRGVRSNDFPLWAVETVYLEDFSMIGTMMFINIGISVYWI